MEEEKNENQEEEELELPEVAEGEEDTTDWKELALKQQGINKRNKTKGKKIKEEFEEYKKNNPSKEPEKSELKKEEKKSDEITLSTGDKALLKSYKDIKGADELALCENWINKYQSTLEEMLEDEVFEAKLGKLREAKKVKEATPSSSKRSVGSDNTAVDFWLNKPFGEVPQELKAQVLNARLEKDEQKSMFGK